MQNFYQPKSLKIVNTISEAPDTRTFTCNYKGKFLPGQFFMLGLLGVGESPISISGACDGKICFTLKKVGAVTRQIYGLKRGDRLSIRGPFGNGFAIETLKNRDILLVAGGLGLAPLRPLINHLLRERDNFGAIHILYGARTPQEILFKGDFKVWSGRKNVRVLLTVDNPDRGWKKDKGVVTTLLKRVELNPKNTTALICGPSIMMRYTVYELLKMQIVPEQIILSLERHMKCGIGKCGHCYLGERFVCLDGPVFRYSELLKLKPEIEL